MDAITKVCQGSYPTTIWSEVDSAGDGDAAGSILALGKLIERYSQPLRTHLRAKFNTTEDQAADWLQDFIQRKVLLGKLLSRASRDRGRFRTFLINSLDHFVISELRRDNAHIRRPDGGFVSLDGLLVSEQGQLAGHPADQFVVEWARAVLTEALVRMETACREKGCLDRWGLFKARLVDPALDGAPVPPYEELVRRFGFLSPGQASNTLTTAKRQFSRIMSEIVAEYAGEGEEADAEIRDMMACLNS